MTRPSSKSPRPTTRTELLAPAGGPESAWAALHYGADAVYLGLPRFSARAEAENFTFEQLDEVIGYAHSLEPRRRVFVTFNTLIQQAELPDAVEMLARLRELKPDALIIQDLGLYRLVKKQFGDLRLHASTQMAVHNLEGALVLKKLGFSRVTLARELSMDEIREITAKSGIETEVFIHGALCYSYSGLCLFSSHAYGRSGNRGRCSYCCRETFDDGDGPLLPFSMKDLAVTDACRSLRDAGVAGLKIEGRMKSALYVAAVTRFYRDSLDGRLSPRDARRAEQDMMTVFSRPWTSLYLAGPKPPEPVIDPLTVGHRGAPIGRVLAVWVDAAGNAWLKFRSERAIEKHDGLQIDLPREPRPYGFAVTELRRAGSTRLEVATSAGDTVEVQLPADHPRIPDDAVVYCASSQAVKQQYKFTRPRPGIYRQRIPIAVKAVFRPASLRLEGTATWAGQTVRAEAVMESPLDQARQPEKTADAVRKALDRMGDTEWVLDRLELDNPEALFASASLLNEARRRLAASLSEERANVRTGRLADLVTPAPSPAAPAPTGIDQIRWSLKFMRLIDLAVFRGDDLRESDEIVLDVAALIDAGQTTPGPDIVERFGQNRVRLALPAIARRSEMGRLTALVKACRDAGWRQWEIGNLYGLQVFTEAPGGVDISADWPCYALNSLAADQWAELGVRRLVLSPEDDHRNVVALLSLRREQAIVPYFQFTPLFISETPPQRAREGLLPADRFINRAGNEFALCRTGHLSVVVNRRPFCLAAHLDDLLAAGAGSLRVDFSYAPFAPERLLSWWRELRAGQPIADSHDGNYGRGLA